MGRRRWYRYASRQILNARGVNDNWTVVTESVGREGSTSADAQPLLIANEWICGNIAQYLRLPIPPFALMNKPGEKGMFVSLHFGTDTPPDDADPIKCLEADLELCTGILLFDILIANSDRHNENLIVDDPAAPKEITIFDHERALFGCMADGDEFKRLNTLWNRLGITGEDPTGGNTHYFLREISSSEYFLQWASWIGTIPERFILKICR